MRRRGTASRSKSTARSTGSISTTFTRGWRATAASDSSSRATRIRGTPSAGCAGASWWRGAPGCSRGDVLNTRPFDEFRSLVAATPSDDPAQDAHDRRQARRNPAAVLQRPRKQTIQQDLAKALDLLKSMSTEEERERATVYMEGLAQMRNDWLREGKPKRALVRRRSSTSRSCAGRRSQAREGRTATAEEALTRSALVAEHEPASGRGAERIRHVAICRDAGEIAIVEAVSRFIDKATRRLRILRQRRHDAVVLQSTARFMAIVRSTSSDTSPSSRMPRPPAR